MRFVIPNPTGDQDDDNNEDNCEGPETSLMHCLIVTNGLSRSCGLAHLRNITHLVSRLVRPPNGMWLSGRRRTH
jgi:hypothetical protein